MASTVLFFYLVVIRYSVRIHGGMDRVNFDEADKVTVGLIAYVYGVIVCHLIAVEINRMIKVVYYIEENIQKLNLRDVYGEVDSVRNSLVNKVTHEQQVH